LWLSAAAALVAPPSNFQTTFPTTHRQMEGQRGVVTMRNTGNQVAWRIARKRMENQTRGRLRLNVFKSHNHIYCQVVDDENMHTLAAMSTLDPGVKSEITRGGNIEAAAVVGAHLAAQLKEKDIDKLFFDRFSGKHKYKYHGRVKALVDACRDNGITI